MWFNSLIASAGGQILNRLGKPALGAPAVKAATIMHNLATSPAAPIPRCSQAQEDQARLAFEKGNAAFEVNYPFVFPSAAENAPKIVQGHGLRAVAGRHARASPRRSRSAGSTSASVATPSTRTQAFDAAACLRNPVNQKLYALKGGLPPTLDALYDDPSLAKAYPFKALIRDQLNNASVRPQSPAYADISLAIPEGAVAAQ